MSAPTPAAEGVTNPSIDDLLTCEDVDPAELAAEEEAKKAAALESGFSAPPAAQ